MIKMKGLGRGLDALRIVEENGEVFLIREGD